jgi:hypothetical protein
VTVPASPAVPIEQLFCRGETFDRIVSTGQVDGWSRDDVLAVLKHRQWDLDGSGRLPRGKRITSPPGLRFLPRVEPTPRKVSTKKVMSAKATPADVAQVAVPSAIGADPAPAPERGRRQPIKHGGPGGLRAHDRRGEPVPEDDPCGCRAAHKAANAAYQRAHYLKKRAARLTRGEAQ